MKALNVEVGKTRCWKPRTPVLTPFESDLCQGSTNFSDLIKRVAHILSMYCLIMTAPYLIFCADYGLKHLETQNLLCGKP